MCEIFTNNIQYILFLGDLFKNFITTPQNALNDADPNDKVIIDRLMVDVSLEKQPDVHINIVIPNEFQPVAKYNIGITAGIETTACPPEWVEGMNRMDLNIVPSKFTKETLIWTFW